MSQKIKTQQELLTAYMKANKDRREIIANNAGFTSGNQYKAHLTRQIAKQPKTVEDAFPDAILPIVIHNVHIIDKSSSMIGSKLVNAVKGVNNEIKQLKQQTKVEYLETVVSFSYDRNYQVHLDKVPVSEASRISITGNGLTALNSSIGNTLERVMKTQQVGEKIIVKVFTDGGENASTGKYKSAQAVRELIDVCKTHDITVSFVGTENDVATVVKNLAIDASNTLIHDNTAAGVEQAFKTTQVATKKYAMRAMAGEDTLKGFYKESGKL